MIGSIDAIERNFKEELENDPEFKKKFLKTRTEILDLGNSQIHLYRREKEEK